MMEQIVMKIRAVSAVMSMGWNFPYFIKNFA